MLLQEDMSLDSLTNLTARSLSTATFKLQKIDGKFLIETIHRLNESSSRIFIITKLCSEDCVKEVSNFHFNQHLFVHKITALNILPLGLLYSSETSQCGSSHYDRVSIVTKQ